MGWPSVIVILGGGVWLENLSVSTRSPLTPYVVSFDCTIRSASIGSQEDLEKTFQIPHQRTLDSANHNGRERPFTATW